MSRPAESSIPQPTKTPDEIAHLQKSPLNERAKMNACIRSFFNARDFLEVETPALVKSPGTEIHIDLFETVFRPLNTKTIATKLYLIPSPELAMKKLLCAGQKRIFQICRAFRNGESPEHYAMHNPEFSMLEWYRSGAEAKDIQNDIEALLPELARHFSGDNNKMHWQPPYARMSMTEAFERFAKINLDTKGDPEKLLQAANKSGLSMSISHFEKNVEPIHIWNDLMNRIFAQAVEPRFPKDRPFFLVDFPASQASLAKIKPNGFADRFEFYLGEVELANGFSELTDPQEQKRRFDEDLRYRKAMALPLPPRDDDFINALDYGLPPSAGVALGLDRLLMVLLGKKHIRDVLLFPYVSS